MKKIMIAVILSGMCGAVYAADFSVLQDYKSSDTKISAPSVPQPTLVNKVAGNKATSDYQGKIQFIDWGVSFEDDTMTTGAIVISGPVAQTLYNTMSGARYRAAPANLASMTPAQVSRDICEARIGTQMICLKLPLISPDGASLVLSGGKPVYNASSYQCDIKIADVKTMEFSKN